MLDISRCSVKQFENNVDNFRLAGPWLDNWWLDSVHASIIVTVLGGGVENSLNMDLSLQLGTLGKMAHQNNTVGFRQDARQVSRHVSELSSCAIPNVRE